METISDVFFGLVGFGMLMIVGRALASVRIPMDPKLDKLITGREPGEKLPTFEEGLKSDIAGAANVAKGTLGCLVALLLPILYIGLILLVLTLAIGTVKFIWVNLPF